MDINMDFGQLIVKSLGFVIEMRKIIKQSFNYF